MRPKKYTNQVTPSVEMPSAKGQPSRVGEGEYAEVVAELREQVASQLARAAKFTPRSAAEIRRDFANATAELTYFRDGEPRSTEPWCRITLNDLSDDEAEAAYRVASGHVARAEGLLVAYERRVSKRHKRYCEAVAADGACTTSSQDVHALESALTRLAMSWKSASGCSERLLNLCETHLLHLKHNTEDLGRLLGELEFHIGDTPRAIDQVAWH